MQSNFRLVLLTIFVVFLFSFMSISNAEDDNLGTADNSAEWLLTGGGADKAPSFQTDVNRPGAIAITSDALSTGAFAKGGCLALFNGFWIAENRFFLTSNAINVVLVFDGFYANDRGRLFLNDIEIGDVDHLDQVGNGVFKLTETGPDEPYFFTGTAFGSVSKGFVPGQINRLTIVVNNTGEIPITAPTMTFAGIFDATTTFIEATLSFDRLGDVNCGGSVDLLDVGPFVELLLSGVYEEKADINRDGIVDLLDVLPFVELLG